VQHDHFAESTSVTSAYWIPEERAWTRGSDEALIDSKQHPARPGSWSVPPRPQAIPDEGTMGKVYEQLDDSLVDFIERQHVFFVGTGPGLPDGHLQCLAKGLDSVPHPGAEVGGLSRPDGSGIETVAHLRENGRLTSCSAVSRARPLIVRSTATAGRRAGRPEWRADRRFPTTRVFARLVVMEWSGCRLVRLRRAPLRVQGGAIPSDRLLPSARGRWAWRRTGPRRTGRGLDGIAGHFPRHEADWCDSRRPTVGGPSLMINCAQRAEGGKAR